MLARQSARRFSFNVALFVRIRNDRNIQNLNTDETVILVSDLRPTVA